MDWLGSGLASDLLGVGSGLFGSIFGKNSAESAADKAYDRQRELMSLQNQYNLDTMQNKHYWEMQDLRKSGLNPLLTTIQPTGTLSSSSAPSVGQANSAAGAAAMANAFSSAFANMKNAQANMINAKANSVKAEADMISANNDTNRTNFMMGPEFELKTNISNAEMNNLIASTNLSNSQAALNLLQKEWIPKLMQANLDEYQMRIATGYLVAKAQDYALRTGADAQMISAHANATSAAAAMYHASSYERFVANAEMLGVHEAALKDAEAQEAIKRADSIYEDYRSKNRINAAEDELFKDPDYLQMRQAGRAFREFFPNGAGSLIPW